MKKKVLVTALVAIFMLAIVLGIRHSPLAGVPAQGGSEQSSGQEIIEKEDSNPGFIMIGPDEEEE